MCGEFNKLKSFVVNGPLSFLVWFRSRTLATITKVVSDCLYILPHHAVLQ